VLRKKNMKIACVDLFCGVGGLTCGLRKAGISVNAGYDLDAACHYPFEKNNAGARFFKADVAELKGCDFETFWTGDYKLLAGCAPCQPFSTYTQGTKSKRDGKWGLLYEFLRIVDEAKPDLVTMENVPQITRHEVFSDFVIGLEGMGYRVSHEVVECVRYGIPQTRKRLVLFASRFGPIGLMPPTHDLESYVTVRDAISHLPPIAAGETHPDDPLHKASGLSPLNMARMRQSVPGGTWRDWSGDLITACHKRETGKTYPSVYGRMFWDKPGSTITTQFHGFGNGRFGHPEQDRAISLREAALLQTFPGNYEFTPRGVRLEFGPIGRLIGNAVPVRLGEIIGKSVVAHVENLPSPCGSGSSRTLATSSS
jgi:DNA (cytosine-5)-methyltransferase 1